MRRLVPLALSVAVLCLLTAASAPAAAPRWSWTDPFPGHYLNAVTFPDDAHGWVCGYPGLIAATADGGDTWTTQASGTTSLINDIVFIDTEHGWAVTEDGAVLSTIDGGLEWTSQAVSPRPLGEVDFVDGLHGWTASSAGLYATIDGGAHWVYTPMGAEHQYGTGMVDFCDQRHGMYASPLDTFYTADGGVTWMFLCGTYPDFAFADPAAAFMAYARGVRYWNYADANDMYFTSVGGDLDHVAATDASRAWATSLSGAMYATVDAGHTWYRETVEGSHHMSDIVVRGDKGWACGRGILRTDHSGFSGLHPPVTTSDAPEYTNHATTVTLAVADTGNDVTGTYYRVGGGSWVPGTTLVIPAPADHSGDGPVQFIRYSTDAGGDEEVPVDQSVFVDTRLPSPEYGCGEPYQWDYWTNRDVAVWADAADPAPSSGAWGEINLHDRQGWAHAPYGLPVYARKDHSADGAHTVSFRAADHAGNMSGVVDKRVYIDTRKPAAAAPYVAHARSRGTGSLVFKIIDARPCSGLCAVSISVYRSGVLVGRLIPDGWFKSNRLVTLRFTCPLKPGSYRFRVKGGDGAGNITPKTTSNTLVVTKARGSVAREVAEQAGGLTRWSPATVPGALTRTVPAPAR